MGESGTSKRYLAKLVKTLEELKAPKDGWKCIDVFDVTEAKSDGMLFQCETCGCSSVRFVHVMYHPNYKGFLHVGCICAGVLEGDILNAKKREKYMKNRAKRRANFPNRPAKIITNPSGVICGATFKYKGHVVSIITMLTKDGKVDKYAIEIDEYCNYSALYDTFEEACYRAFDQVDPAKSVLSL